MNHSAIKQNSTTNSTTENIKHETTLLQLKNTTSHWQWH